ncbi:NUDIX hydrolase [Candidatus Microgenomates bacterium]|nr:MAG: NUDIX hydrolase [Candidatus Microgenomates bacterium]
MSKHQKVAVIVWTIDPEGNKRFLLRHNKPFNGYEDEWTITFGDIEDDESLEKAAKREISEEFGISGFEEIKNLDYKIEFEGKHGLTEAQFVYLKVKNIDVPIRLNEESIGYDWMLLEKAKEVMRHEDEKKAFDLI